MRPIKSTGEHSSPSQYPSGGFQLTSLVEWKIDDGYVGHGSQYVEIDLEEIAECGSEEEVKELIDNLVKEDFEQHISWEIQDGSIQEAISHWKKSKR